MANEFDNLPPKLAEDLKRAIDRPVEIPLATDATIRLAAHRQIGRRRWVVRSLMLGGVAAAIVFLVLGLWLPSLLHDARPGMAAGNPMDLDRSGRVDILDAYALARQLPSGQDITGDGRADQADVDAIAKAAVELKGGRR